MAIEQVSLAGLKAYLDSVKVTRGIEEVVLHHTWSPTAAQYRGKVTWDAIRDYHVNVRGWSDIGYHFGAAKDGSIWKLRPVTRAGAHVLNRNEHTVGMVLIGNFDVEDPMANGLPLAAQVVAVVVERFQLKLASVRFHREFQDKTCPGTRIELAAFREMVGAASQSRLSPKIILLPQNSVVECRAEVSDGVTRCDLRPLATALGCRVTDHLADQGKVYLERVL